MQTCPKNVDTGPLIGNGKGAPVASGPGLSLPPSALVGPPSPARGLAGLAPPHGANAWDTDRVQLNIHRSNLNSQSQQQQISPASTGHSIVAGAQHSRAQNLECRTKVNPSSSFYFVFKIKLPTILNPLNTLRLQDENTCTENKRGKCNCQKRGCTSTCEVKLEVLSPTETLSPSPTSSRNEKAIQDFKLENNNVKCESCSVGIVVGQENISCAANCNVKCETGYKCEMMKCEQCMKEGQMAIMEHKKDSGVPMMIDDKTDSAVKEEINDVVVVDMDNWQKPDYEPIVQEVVDDTEIIVSDEGIASQEQITKGRHKITKRKLSLDSLSEVIKKRKLDKRTLSVGSTRDSSQDDRLTPEIISQPPTETVTVNAAVVVQATSKKSGKKDSQCQKRKAEGGEANASDGASTKKAIVTKVISNGMTNFCSRTTASDTSINETIDDVIQQSLQMSQKKDRTSEKPDKNPTETKKKKSANLLSTIKKVTKRIDVAKAVVTEKLSSAKSETKSAKETVRSKIEAKGKPKALDAKSKSSKVKTKIAEVIKTKVLDAKPKVPDVKTREAPPIVEATECVKRAALVKKKQRKSTKKTSACAKKTIPSVVGKPDNSEILIDSCSLAKRPFLKPKWSNGWSWEGDSYEAKVYLTVRLSYNFSKFVVIENDESTVCS